MLAMHGPEWVLVATLSNRDPGTQKVDHGPNAVGFAAFNDFQGFEVIEGLIRRDQPFSQGLIMDGFG